MTAITATYLMTSAIRAAIKFTGVSRLAHPLSPHPGRFPQSIAGAQNTVALNRNDDNKNMYIYLIIY